MSQVSIVEVGLRDGLQNESQILSAEQKIFIGRCMLHAGLRRLEVGAFVREEKVPQMAHSADVIAGLHPFSKKAILSALVPNEHGMLDALNSAVNEIAVFTAATDSFCRANINCSIEESFERFKPVFKIAKKNKLRIRGYLSTAFGCPYEGSVSEAKVIRLIQELLKLGCYEVSVGDTIGVATPLQVKSLVKKLKAKTGLRKIAGHFHDTRGTALANILAAYDLGVRTFDSSIGGLGGCPYAPGASGNVATEEVIYMFDGMKVKTGVQLAELTKVSQSVSQVLGRPVVSKMAQAGIFVPKGHYR